MAENKNEKKKTTSTKKTTKKKTTTTVKSKPTTKSNAKKTTNTVAKKSSGKKTPTKKVTTKKTQTKPVQKKQVTNKTVNQPKQPVKVAPKVKELTKEEQLEKTLIFDGRQNQNLVEVVEKLEEKNVVLEDKVIKRSKTKKIAIIVLTALIAVILAITTWYVTKDVIVRKESNQTVNSNIYKKVIRNYKTISDINKQEKKDKENNKHESAADTIKEIEYSNIETISLADFERKILEQENMTVLIASSTCYPCLTFEPTINEVYKEKNSKIYRLNISLLSEGEITRFRTYYAFKVTPTIFTIKDGVATAESTGVLTKEELIDWLDKNV